MLATTQARINTLRRMPTLRLRILSLNAVKAFALLSIGILSTLPAAAQTVFDYTNFSSTAGLSLNGVATVVNDKLRLTTSGQNTVIGSAGYNSALVFSQGFSTSFAFQITDPAGIVDLDGNNGGDGVSLNIVSDSTTNLAANQDFCIGLNTFHNPGAISGNSISLVVASNIVANVDLNPLGINLSDGLVHMVTVDFDGDIISTIIDNQVIFSQGGIDLSALDGRYILLGSPVGDASENHDIQSWSFQSAVTVPEPGTIALLLPLAPVLLVRRKRSNKQ